MPSSKKIESAKLPNRSKNLIFSLIKQAHTVPLFRYAKINEKIIGLYKVVKIAIYRRNI